MSNQSNAATQDGSERHSAGPCRKWRGAWIVANGRRFADDCPYCGWPRPDHAEQGGSTGDPA